MLGGGGGGGGVMPFCRLLIFLSKSFLNSARSTISVSNSLDPGQARHVVGTDLGPNCLQKKYQQTTVVGKG